MKQLQLSGSLEGVINIKRDESNAPTLENLMEHTTSRGLSPIVPPQTPPQPSSRVRISLPLHSLEHAILPGSPSDTPHSSNVPAAPQQQPPMSLRELALRMFAR